MKQIILPSSVLEFTWFVIDGSMEKNGLAHFPLQKSKLSPPSKKGPQEIWYFLSP